MERSARSHAPAGTANSSDDDIGGLPRIKQDLAQPPSIPEVEQISTGGPLIVEAELVARVLKRVVDGSGTEIHARMPAPSTARFRVLALSVRQAAIDHGHDHGII